MTVTLITTIFHPLKPHLVKVYHDTTYGEYSAKFYDEAGYMSHADYFSECEQDVIDTAKYWVEVV